MAESKVSISNQAVTKCGAATISAFTDGTHEANVCSTMYDNVRNGLLYYTFWNFAITNKALNRLNETPTNTKYLYVFSLPGDVVRIKGFFDTDGMYSEDYSIEGSKVFANEKTLFIEYVKNIVEDDMPVFFIETLIAKVALEINEAITGVGTLTNRLAADYREKLRAARIADGQENPPHNIVPPGRYVEAHLGNTGLTNRRLRHSNT